jgi:hypothetical protein
VNPIPGADCDTSTNRSDSGYGNGFSKTPSMTLKIALFAPTPMPIVTSVTTANIGERASLRNECLN